MTRLIRPGPRAAVALGTMGAALSAFLAYAVVTRHRPDLVQAWLLIVAILGVVLIGIYSVRIEVQDDRILRIDGFWRTRAIRFEDIDHSEPRTLAERDHPLWLDIYPKNSPAGSRPLRLPLKSCRQADVAWLISLKQLRIRS